MRYLFFIAAAFAASAGAHAQDTDTDKAEPAEAAQIAAGQETDTDASTDTDTGTDKEASKRICRTQPVTGSRTRVNRICMTRAEWGALSRNTQQGINDFVGSSRSNACGSIDPVTGNSNC